MKVFEVGRKGAQHFDDYLRRDPANEELVARVREAKPTATKGFQFKVRGDDRWEKVRSLVILREQIEGIRLTTGKAIWARRADASAVFVLRASEFMVEAAPCPDPAASPAVKALWEDVQVEVARLRLEYPNDQITFAYQGIYNCRRIDGSYTWSQHSWRNALDGHVRRNGSFSDSLTSILVSRVKAKGHASEVLWHVSGHYGHFHMTGDPKKYGTPPCA